MHSSFKYCTIKIIHWKVCLEFVDGKCIHKDHSSIKYWLLNTTTDTKKINLNKEKAIYAHPCLYQSMDDENENKTQRQLLGGLTICS